MNNLTFAYLLRLRCDAPYIYWVVKQAAPFGAKLVKKTLDGIYVKHLIPPKNLNIFEVVHYFNNFSNFDMEKMKAENYHRCLDKIKEVKAIGKFQNTFPIKAD